MSRVMMRFFGAAAVALFAAACDNSPVDLPVETELILATEALTLHVGSFSAVSAEVVDQSGIALRDAMIKWASSNAAIVSVDAWGNVEAIAEGAAQIIASYGALSASIPVTILREERFYIQKVEFTETSGSHHRSLNNVDLNVRVFDGFGRMSACNGVNSLPISASSSNVAVATVDAVPVINNCRLTVALHHTGTATITLTINGSTTTYDLTVTDGSLKIRWVANLPATVVAGDTVSFSAIVTNENGEPVEGRTVHFDRSRGSLLESEAVTDADGVATVRWSAPTSLRYIAVLNVVTATITAATENLGGLGRISDSQSITIDRGKPASLSFFHLDPDLNYYVPVPGDTLTMETGTNRPILLVTYDKYGNFVNSTTSTGAALTLGGSMDFSPLSSIDISDYSLTADFRAISIRNATAETVDFEAELEWDADEIMLSSKFTIIFVNPS